MLMKERKLELQAIKLSKRKHKELLNKFKYNGEPYSFTDLVIFDGSKMQLVDFYETTNKLRHSTTSLGIVEITDADEVLMIYENRKI